jgi:hypothetical protein
VLAMGMGTPSPCPHVRANAEVSTPRATRTGDACEYGPAPPACVHHPRAPPFACCARPVRVNYTPLLGVTWTGRAWHAKGGARWCTCILPIDLDKKKPIVYVIYISQ